MYAGSRTASIEANSPGIYLVTKAYESTRTAYFRNHATDRNGDRYSCYPGC